jgi:hypothetical protein
MPFLHSASRALEWAVAIVLATAVATIILLVLCHSPAGAEPIDPRLFAGCKVRTALGVTAIVFASLSVGSCIGFLAAALFHSGARS